MADQRMSVIFKYLRPTLDEHPLPGTSALEEFKEFWISLTDDEKTEFALGVE